MGSARCPTARLVGHQPRRRDLLGAGRAQIGGQGGARGPSREGSSATITGGDASLIARAESAKAWVGCCRH